MAKKDEETVKERQSLTTSRVLIPVIVISVLLTLVIVWVVTFFITSSILTTRIDSLPNAVEEVEETEQVDITAIKIGYDGKTYTIDEFVQLEEIPTVVDILIMQEDGVMSNKPAYVSYSDDKSISHAQYIDGEYGRLILPASYHRG